MNVQQYYRAINNPATPSGPNPDSFIMTFALGASDSITLPLASSGTYNFTVNWGDGSDIDTITAWNQAERVHSYAGKPAGDYVVTITGTCTVWSFQSVSTSRLKLKGVDQWGNTGLVALSFLSCSNIQYLASDGIKMGSNASLLQCFQSCNLTAAKIPSNLFSGCSGVTNCGGLFFSNPSLGSIPAGLLDPMISVTNFGGAFDNCGLTSLPTDLFRYNTEVTNFGGIGGTFGTLARNNFSAIPADLFKYNTKVTSFQTTFQNCTSLSSIPVDTFRYNTLVTSFQQTFQGCSALTTVPVDTFRYNTLVTNFAGTFALCSNFNSIPTDIFRYNPSVNNFSTTFQYCSSLSTLPIDIFRYNTAVTTFQQCFQGVGVSSFNVDLFRYNTSVNNFAFVFANNSSLTSIPSGIFQYNTSLTQAAGIFAFCTNLTSLPSGLFNNNTGITNFGSAFGGTGLCGGCTNLTTIPTNLFNNTSNVTSYSQAFLNCPNLNISVSSLVSGIDMTKVTTTNQMFSGCTSLTGNGQDLIDKPKAAGYTVGTGSTTGSYRTFFNCTSLSDFATISANYK